MIPVGASIVFQFKRSLRIYSLAVDKSYRMNGVGESLMHHILDFAVSHGYERITLEADIGNTRLIEWYKKLGFEASRTLPDYYGTGETALRMVQLLANKCGTTDRIVIVVDDPATVKKHVPDIKFVSDTSYLSDTNYASSSRFHVLNLCGSYKTHSLGYYVSLLASARNHRVTPSVMAVKDAMTPVVAQSLLDEIQNFVLNKTSATPSSMLELTCIMGKTPDSQHDELAKKLFLCSPFLSSPSF